jgi:TonB family protein
MKIATFSNLLIASAFALAGCSAPPAADVNDAKPSVDQATAADAAKPAAKKKPDANARRSKTAVVRDASKAAETPVRIAEAVTPPTKIKNVQPVYPAIARAARVEGSVLLEVDVDADGKVSDARVIRSVPLLDQAALDAVRQWEYTPMRKGSVAVPATMTVSVNFIRT